MDGQPLGLVERRSRVEAAREALVGISQVLYQCSGAELAEVMGEVDSLVALSAAARVAVTAEAIAGEAVASAPEEAAVLAPPIDVLGVVLSTPGSLGTWQLTSPSSSSTLRSERRDAHRRTRHGKDRRIRVRGAELVQPRLFADRK